MLREVVWHVLEVHWGYIDATEDMHDGMVTSVRNMWGRSINFPTTIGLHQGITMHILDGSRGVFYLRDCVLIDESRARINCNLDSWRDGLESEGFKLNRTKTEYTEWKFSNRRPKRREELVATEVVQRDWFRYLGSIIHHNKEI